MNLNDLLLTEAKFLLDTSASGKDLLLITFYELLALNAIIMVGNKSKTATNKEKYIVDKGLRFNEFNDKYYKNFHISVMEYEESIINPDRIREPLLTPYRLIEKVFIKSNDNYKEEVSIWLKKKDYIKDGFMPWKKFKLTEKGAKIKNQLFKRLNEFEKTLKEGNLQNNEYLISLIIELGPLVLLTEKLDKAVLTNIKDEITKSAPVFVDTQFATLLDLYFIVEFDYYNLGFEGFDLFNE